MHNSHLFVDESKASGYVLVAVLVSASQITEVRKVLRSLQLPGQPRIHMKKESDSRKLQILSAIRNLNVEIWIFQSRSQRLSELTLREKCLRELVSKLSNSKVSRMCLERDITLERFDRQVIIESMREAEIREVLYWHESSVSEPLLSLPDAVAWAWAKGGKWATACGDISLITVA